MIFRQFFYPESAALSYLIADPVTRKAVVIDGVLAQLAVYAELLHHVGLELVYALETHIHEDHVSAAPELKAASGARVVVHEAGRMPCADIRTRDGDMLYVGEESMEVIHTPGHSPCSVTYRWKQCLFTGDTLLIGRVGRCHRPDADPGQLYDSITNKLYTRAGETLVYPGHNDRGQRVTTIEQERLTNADLPAGRTRADFLAMSRRADAPAEAASFCDLNRSCGTNA